MKRVRSMKGKEKALAELEKTARLLDQLVAKGVIHKNKAANNKSRLTLYVNKLK
jgi:small subunit ribosomal protein S20